MSLLCYFLLLFYLSNIAHGGVPQITMSSIDKCNIKGTPIDFNPTFEVKDGKPLFSMTLNLDTPITEDYGYHAVLKKAQPDGKYAHYLDGDGVICDAIGTYFEETWNKARDQMDPKVEEQCNIPVGKYSLTDFYAGPDEIELPDGFLGDFLATIRMKNEDDEAVYCIELKFKIEDI